MKFRLSKQLKRVVKPWGWEVWYAHSKHYVGKIIYVKKGKRLSKQYHRFKHETIFSDRSKWVLEIAGRKRVMHPGDAMAIKPRVIHRFTAPYEDAWLYEVSTPQVKDVVRLEDDYGR